MIIIIIYIFVIFFQMFYILLKFAGIDIILAIYLQDSIKQTNTNKQTYKYKYQQTNKHAKQRN